jgi:hypothetical protein
VKLSLLVITMARYLKFLTIGANFTKWVGMNKSESDKNQRTLLPQTTTNFVLLDKEISSHHVLFVIAIAVFARCSA